MGRFYIVLQNSTVSFTLVPFSMLCFSAGKLLLLQHSKYLPLTDNQVQEE